MSGKFRYERLKGVRGATDVVCHKASVQGEAGAVQ